MLAQLIAPISGLLDKFVEDKDQKNALAHELATMADNHAQELAKGQLAVNAVEAAHKSLFVAGWRPAIGWVCAIGLGYQFLILPFAGLINAYYALPAELPAIASAELTTLVMSLLGLGGLRSFEKSKGLTK